MIHDFKFNDKTIYAKGLGELAFKFANSLIAESDIIIPVPIHPKRLRKRKYNHAALLAKKIAKLAKIKVDVDAIIKNSQTHSQVGLSRAERVKNLRDSFQISSSANVKGKNVLLIDDVMTTGATANECAKRVFVVTAARTYS